MIDILEKGKREIELVLHFVNKHFSPTMSPVIKRFRMTLDPTTRRFLLQLQFQIAKSSHLVSKVANAHASFMAPPASQNEDRQGKENFLEFKAA
jgi:hypothetical protein